MKKTTALKVTLILFCLALLNFPIFLIAKKHTISHEQLNIPSPGTVLLDLTTADVRPKKQLITAQEDRFNGISMLTVNDKIFDTQRKITLSVYSTTNPEKALRKKTYEISTRNPFSNAITLSFDEIQASKNNQYIVVVSSAKTSQKKVRDFIQNNQELDLNVRPLYYTQNIFEDIYYRTSQYKPFLLKNPTLVILYMLFNIFFLAIILEVSRKLQIKK